MGAFVQSGSPNSILKEDVLKLATVFCARTLSVKEKLNLLQVLENHQMLELEVMLETISKKLKDKQLLSPLQPTVPTTLNLKYKGTEGTRANQVLLPHHVFSSWFP